MRGPNPPMIVTIYRQGWALALAVVEVLAEGWALRLNTLRCLIALQ